MCIRDSLQIASHVQSKTVLRDPATATNTDCRNLLLIKPDPSESFNAHPLQAENLQHINHHLFQLTQIPVQIRATTTEIEHRISHQLTWRVMRHFPTTIDAVQWGRRMLWIEQQMVFTGAAAKGVTARVLQQPDRFRISSGT